MKLTQLKPEFCENIPQDLVEGVLYISMKYRTAIHKCPCGWCGWKVVTGFKTKEADQDGWHGWDDGWNFTQEGELVTLNPSVGCFQHPCKSHYYIRCNEIVWC